MFVYTKLEEGLLYEDYCRGCGDTIYSKKCNKSNREEFRCEKCNKKYTWLKLFQNLFF